MAARKGNPGYRERRALSALDRFRSFCRFDAETGCVVWEGGRTAGRGYNVPYGAFWYQGRRWFAHRWAAQFIHGLEIDTWHVDHCCPLPRPNTLCVQHLQTVTPMEHARLTVERRRHFIHLQVGLLDYEEVYGHHPHIPVHDEPSIPFHIAPAWLELTKGSVNVPDLCPF